MLKRVLDQCEAANDEGLRLLTKTDCVLLGGRLYSVAGDALLAGLRHAKKHPAVKPEADPRPQGRPR